MAQLDLTGRCEAAKRAALQTGAMLREKRAALAEVPHESKGRNDIVTRMDRAAEEGIVALLHAAFPRDDFFGEEEGRRRHGGEGCWIIDPIDGTENYVRGFPGYAVSIAFAEREEEPDIGVVYCPPMDDLYWAVRGQGAWLNGRRLAVSARTDAAEAITMVSPPFRLHQFAEEYFALYQRIFSLARDVRNTGSAALHTCYVAAGLAEGYMEKGIQPYDVAAGMAILSEAGGKWSSLYRDGHPFATNEILATNGHLHEWYQERAREIHRGMTGRG